MATSTKNIWKAEAQTVEMFNFNGKEYDVVKNHECFRYLIRMYYAMLSVCAVIDLCITLLNMFKENDIIICFVLYLFSALVFTYIYQPYYLEKHLIE